jgi:sugar transferase (PEP-CTERM/EpsH1 system associated)
MKVLLLTYGVPWPLNSGAHIRDFNLLQGLAQRAEVTLCCFAKDETEIPDLSELRKLCREVRVFQPGRRSLWGHAAAAAKALWTGMPLATCPFFYPEFAAELRSIARREPAEILQIEHSILAGYIRVAPESCHTVLSFQNIGSVQYARMARLNAGLLRRAGFRIKAWLIGRCEAHYAVRVSHCLAVSFTDAALLRRAYPSAAVSVVENGVDCMRFQPLPEASSGNELLFAGVLSYPPNTDAVLFFFHKILPLVRREVPDARLLIAGQNPPPEVRALAASGPALLLSDVADMTPCYRRARLVVVPLRAGGGTRLKILEAMALGRAVVSTSIGCEGIGVSHGRDILIADEPEAFAAGVVSLLRDEAARAALTARARQTVERDYDWPILAAKQLEVYSSLVRREESARGCLHLYLSPHLDDAILSCGGLIHAQRQAGERVGVLTLCAGFPERAALTPLAEQYEATWSEAGEAIAVRRAEDAAALANWGVRYWHGGTLDAIYRRRAGAPYYPERSDLFREPHTGDAAALLPAWEALVKHIEAEHGLSVVLYAPLGVGGHIDHELTRQLAERLGDAGRTVHFYEDYPYAELAPGGIEAAQARFGPRAWTSRTVAIDAHAKIEAVRNYRSQIGRVFGCDKDLVRRISGFTAETACAINPWERMRRSLAPGGLRLRLWRRVLGYHAHAERVWTWCAGNRTK